MTAHDVVYGAPALYDLAFSYRDYAGEATFLSAVYERRRGRPPESFLELAAGPARHALEMSARGLRVLALDRAPAMASYAAHLAAARRLELPYLVADMTSFQVARTFDLAACLLCSATYLLGDDAFVAHLGSVAAALSPGGIYVLELPYPSDLSDDAKTKDAWTVEDEGGVLDVEWKEEPAACRVRLHYRPHQGPAILVEDESPQRDFTRSQVEALVAASGAFQVEAVFGALHEAVPLEAESAWRMVAVLGRR